MNEPGGPSDAAVEAGIPGRSFEYAADLGETKLPEMLYTIDRFQVPGTIEAERDGITKRVLLKDGSVVHASSTDRHDTLGSYLQRTGRLSAEQFARSMERRSESDDRLYGEILIDTGLLSPAEIYRAIREQIESIVWSLFYWETGTVRFRIGELSEPSGFHIHLPMRQVILQGIKRAPNAKALVARLGQRETVLEPSFRAADLIAVALEAEELELLRLVDGERSLYEICTEGPFSPAENGKLMYAFQVLGLARRPRTETIDDTDEPAVTATTDATPSPSARPPENPDGESETRPPGRKVIKIRMKTAGDKFGADA